MAIQVLAQDVVNQIAAGEVVERPAHLVKELIENSIDAKSQFIHVEVALGGRYLKINDNGTGILKTDLELALTRHATSKINQTNDLWNLNSFGFRGEALASVAAVSKLVLSSKEINQQEAFQIQCEFGQLSEIAKASKEQGTEIIITDLFENVPARLKFLKTDATESAQIKIVIKAMAMAYPEIEFKLIINQKLELYFPAKENRIERIQDVLEQKKVFKGWAERGQYKAEVYFCGPSDVAKNSKNIWIYAQNRWIQDRGLQAAINEAYRSLLMHGEYPICTVFLYCNPQDIDVNIHPTKSQVKFQDSSLAFRAVQASLRDSLETAPWIPKSDSIKHSEPDLNDFKNEKLKTPDISPSFFFDRFEQEKTVLKKKSFAAEEFQVTQNDFKKLAVDQVEVGYWQSMEVIGQINQTYFVCQRNDKMILIDQHAAHERVAFEKLMSYWNHRLNHEKIKNFSIQTFLFPLVIDLSIEKVESILQVKSDLSLMGIEIERMGPSVLGIKSSPSFIKDSVYPFIFEKMANELIDHGGSFSLEKTIIDLFATMACHSVVRAGQSMSLSEMKHLLSEMDQYPLSSFCPHGRPVSIDYSFYEIEKKFGRIN